MHPNFPFLSTASNAILKPGHLLRWKVRLVKDVGLSLQLTEMMKIARLTSPLLDAFRQSSPRPRLRHGKRLALLCHPNQTPKLYTLFSALSLALLLRHPPLLTSLNVFSQGIGFGLRRLSEISLSRFSAEDPAYQSQRLPLCAPPSHVPGGFSLVLLLSFLPH